MSREEDAAQDRALSEIDAIQAERLARATAASAPRPHHLGIECIDCDEEIDARRLHALPSAIRCTHCQSMYERLTGQGRRG